MKPGGGNVRADPQPDGSKKEKKKRKSKDNRKITVGMKVKLDNASVQITS